MARKAAEEPIPGTLAELLAQLGDVSPGRVRLRPPPGTAVESDVVAVRQTPERWLCELADGVLIHKASTFTSSVLAGCLNSCVLGHARKYDLGVVLAPTMPYLLQPGLVRIPDGSFIGWERFERRHIPDEEIGTILPHLVMEVVTEEEQPREIERKTGEYMLAGVREVWLVFEATRRARICSETAVREISLRGYLASENLLPGFSLSMTELFSCLNPGPRAKG